MARIEIFTLDISSSDVTVAATRPRSSPQPLYTLRSSELAVVEKDYC